MACTMLQGLQPEKVFDYFEQLTRIPRGSRNEKAVSDYIVDFAKAHGYRYEQDAAWNVKLWAPATPGYESRPSIALQAHLDMVCTCEPGVEFDFAAQPIPVCIEDGFVTARGTTLGADDGAGVALILALLDDASLPHPPLQAIFTTGEEVVFVGAEAMDPDWIDSDYLIGLDYSNNKRILTSAAGLSVLRCQLDTARERPAGRWTAVHVAVSGMQGGHSGNMIHRDRANAIKVLGELVSDSLTEDVRLSSFTAGKLINVIPAAAECVLLVPEKAAPQLHDALDARIAAMKSAYWHTEPQLHIAYADAPAEGCPALTKTSAEQLLSYLSLCFAGAYRLADDQFSRAECSANPAVLTMDEESAVLTISMRSNSEYFHDRLIAHQRQLAALCGWRTEIVNRAGSWEFNPHSRLLEQAIPIFRRVAGYDPEIAQIHAGVEGGVFEAKARQHGRKIDMINLGCMTYDVHTPNERLEISSVGPLYEILREILKNVQ